MAQRSAPTQLGAAELRRYSRHLLIPEVALAGQERLSQARALCIGAGGLGSPVLQYLAAAGVGRIGIADDDIVDETNLQRQTLFSTSDVGMTKASVAARRVRELNPYVNVDPIALRVDAANARALVALYDVVIDCTDRFESRYVINDACVLEKRPDVYGSIFRFDGQVAVFGAGGAPCYRCLFPVPPPAASVASCAEGGVLGALAGIVGALQAAEALKVLLGIGEALVGRVLLIDALGAHVREIAFPADAACALCGAHPTIFEPRADGAAEERGGTFEEVDAQDLDAALASSTLLDVREPHEAVLGFVPGALHIPASELDARLHELDTATRYVVACRIGQRSRWAATRLHEAGFGRVAHLRDGLLAYAAQRDEFAAF